jgi:hypothetical protein
LQDIFVDMKNVNRIIEMALDFSDYPVDDPHDPEFHGLVAGDYVTVYIPTTTDHLLDILVNGITTRPLVAKLKRQEAEVFFDVNDAVNKAHVLGSNNSGAVIVAQKKIKKPLKGSGKAGELVAAAGIYKNVSEYVDPRIKPTDITGVLFPAETNAWEYPVKEFISRARMGEFEPYIQPEDVLQSKPLNKFRRLNSLRPESWQIVILRYVQNLLNYSSNYYDYLVHEQGALAQKIIGGAKKIGLSQMQSWTAREFMEWIYQILPPPGGGTHDRDKEEDIQQVINATNHEGTSYPLYRTWKKYADNTSWEIRSGRKPRPEKHD